MNYEEQYIQAAPVYQPPVQQAPVAPVQTAPHPSMTIKPSEPNSSTFVPDAKTRELLSRVHPELTNALINIAIKKFSTESDFLNYFIRDEFRKVVEKELELVVPSTGDTGGTTTQPVSEVGSTPVEFGSW